MIRLMLFGTPGCHLCEQAESIINHCLRDGLDLIIEDVDIAEQEQWQDQYAIRIPVLYHPETKQELGWPFDQVDVKEFISSLSSLARFYEDTLLQSPGFSSSSNRLGPPRVR